ncbi:hypothetical protein GGR22_000713 [Flavobacterium gossypii]|uniref:SHOCT domain-containing protein n=1 Tax=Flavobacterium gossypii TaxID=1646119 RepID=A0ABR6DLM3_9FLAO|nr:SHOCT domain-containing protein [Flavobacterium gossypii]MBA9072587.1 hypothetical protein [Flavobacterium gossypii]
MNKIDEILKLKELLNSGVITQNDFTELKNKLLEDSNPKNEDAQIKVEIGIDEKECPNCNVILNKDIEKCEFCDYDFISKQVKIENDKVNIGGKSRKKVLIFSIIMLFILFAMWFVVDFMPHKNVSKDEVLSKSKNDYNAHNIVNQKNEIDSLVAKNKLSIENQSNYSEDNLENLKFNGSELDFEIYHDSKSHVSLIVETPRLSMNDGKYSEKHKYYFNSNNEVFAQESNFYNAYFNEDLGEVISKKTTLTNYYVENRLVKSDTVYQDKDRKPISCKHYANLTRYIKRTGLKLSFKAN